MLTIRGQATVLLPALEPEKTMNLNLDKSHYN